MFTRRQKEYVLVSDPPPTPPDPAEDDLVEVLWDAYMVAEALAREPVRSQDIGKWVAPLMQVLHDAILTIVHAKAAQAEGGELLQGGEPMTPARMEAREDFIRRLAKTALASEDLVRDLAKLAFEFTREKRHDIAKLHKAKPYREALLYYMDKARGMQAMEAHSFTNPHFFDMAGVILSGTLVYPEIDQSQVALAKKLHDGLGADFLQKITDTRERVESALRIAGLGRKQIWNLLEGAEARKKSRQNPRPEGAPGKPRRRQPRGV